MEKRAQTRAKTRAFCDACVVFDENRTHRKCNLLRFRASDASVGNDARGEKRHPKNARVPYVKHRGASPLRRRRNSGATLMIISHTDVTMEEYLCPIFLGCTICVTGLSSLDRKEVQRLSSLHGGQYTGQLKMNESTHLIVHEAKGQKYECARKWNVHCVSIQWFFDSIERGFCQDESMYKMDPVFSSKSMPDTSTPTSSNKIENRALSDVSHISNISTSCVNESAFNSVMSTRLEPPPDTLENLDISSLQAPDDLLDGCRIYVCGFGGRKLDKLRRLINCGGGVRFNQLTGDLTHVIVGENDEELKQFLNRTDHRSVLSYLKVLATLRPRSDVQYL
ncbi:unnamed protein product [Ranitomeya imitator]|uniref:BRCT domain-containing protein n=1 Tax=Ranitomeya imitator TaxID=111125 RepID=A0ABN9LFE4_9NEOB|nr:unnamed protein product [Ranitomeya imitator]